MTQALAAAQAAKADAQAAVDGLPAVVQTEKDAFQDRIDGLTDISIPAVNDTDGNGIADDVDALIAAAGDLVAAAEQAYQDAQTALTTAQSDNIITQGEFDALTQALADAQAAVDALPAVVQTEKDAFQDRIDGLTDISIPAVNDTDGNGIADDVDALIAAAEQAYQDAQTALTTAQSDNIITQGEFDALTQALADAQAAVNALPAVVQTEKDALQDRIDDLTDISVPPVTPINVNATDDEFEFDLGIETRVDRTEVSGTDIAIVDLLGNNATGLDFSIPQTTGSAGKGITGNISVTVSQQDLISIGEAVQIVIYQQTATGPVEVARGTSQGGIITVGGIGIIGVVNSNDSIRLDFTNLPEGNYTVAVQADDSVLTTLLKDVALQDLGGEGAILGASNEAAIYAAINAVLGPLGTPVVTLVQAILLPVNAIGLPLSSVVNQLLDVLPVNVIDYIVNEAVAPLLSNLLTIYEKTNISVTGNEEVFANFTMTGNIFADNGNGQDVVGGGSIVEIDGTTVTGTVTIQGEYGNLLIDTATGGFTYTVTAGEAAVGKTEIFDYKLSNGATSDTAQIIINIAGTPADPGELTPPDYVDQVVANDDLATVKNYQETEGEPYHVCRRLNILRNYSDEKIKLYP
ncbi:MAG: hypothetical protein GAK29_04081 [Acinetobacter bereziniae]|uniref:Minor extracellular protease Epr GA-like domain-containing protein n=1 Tax=Acinetobacter bereziniae TaxID=106648 RepID=A0A833PCA5_ACIBZ|nr:MAG: hypothetical protein GAK29_04081 [Acinetobacter bereziniae]